MEKKTRSNAYCQCLRGQVGPSRSSGPCSTDSLVGPFPGSYKRSPMLPIHAMTSSFLHSPLNVNGTSLKPELFDAMFPRRPSVDQSYHTNPILPWTVLPQRRRQAPLLSVSLPSLLPPTCSPCEHSQCSAGSATPVVGTVGSSPVPWQCQAPVGPDLPSLL